MNRAEITGIIDQITYKRGWTVQVHPGQLEQVESRCAERPYLQVHYDGTGEYGIEPWTGRKWMLSTHMTKSEIVYTAFKAIMAAEEHETRELFKYRGHEVCGPHFDVDDIVEQIEARRLHADVRPDAMQGAT